MVNLIRFTGNLQLAEMIEDLVMRNKLARLYDFGFARVSGFEGFVEMLNQSERYINMICVDDTSDGYTQLTNSPHRRVVKSIFVCMAHELGDMDGRQQCFTIMHEIFRQFMSAILPEKRRFEKDLIYIDPSVTFNEMDKYISATSACAWFQIAFDIFTDLQYRKEEWEDEPQNHKQNNQIPSE